MGKLDRIGMTEKQALLLDFLRQCNAQNYTPSFQEMSDHLGLNSKSGAHRLVVALEERGRIERLPNRARTLKVIDVNALARFTDIQLLTELASRNRAARLAGAK